MNPVYRNMSLVLEVERSFKYFRKGLAEVQAISGKNSFYDPLLLFLSGGFERLFKVMLCLHHKETYGKLPEPNEIWKLREGHNISLLKKKIEGICSPINAPFGKDDYKIIIQDEIINTICDLLGEFAQQARYFNLDAVLGKRQGNNSERAWDKLETKINKDHYGEEEYFKIIQDSKRLDELYTNFNTEVVIHLEKFLRAITRQFTFGVFSNDAPSMIMGVDDFGNLKDQQLGKINYLALKPYERIK